MKKFLKKNKLFVRIASLLLFLGGIAILIFAVLNPVGKTYTGTKNENGIVYNLTYDFKENNIVSETRILQILNSDGTPFDYDYIVHNFTIYKYAKVNDDNAMGVIVGPVIMVSETESLTSTAATVLFILSIVMVVAGLTFEGMLCSAIYPKKKKK